MTWASGAAFDGEGVGSVAELADRARRWEHRAADQPVSHSGPSTVLQIVVHQLLLLPIETGCAPLLCLSDSVSVWESLTLHRPHQHGRYALSHVLHAHHAVLMLAAVSESVTVSGLAAVSPHVVIGRSRGLDCVCGDVGYY
jgi:hypothetical protein